MPFKFLAFGRQFCTALSGFDARHESNGIKGLSVPAGATEVDKEPVPTSHPCLMRSVRIQGPFAGKEACFGESLCTELDAA